MDTCICMAESLRCSPETITAMLTSDTPAQNKKLNNKKIARKLTDDSEVKPSFRCTSKPLNTLVQVSTCRQEGSVFPVTSGMHFLTKVATSGSQCWQVKTSPHVRTVKFCKNLPVFAKRNIYSFKSVYTLPLQRYHVGASFRNLPVSLLL